MSDTLTIGFAADVPGAVVEVVAPDLRTVGRFWVGPGAEERVGVPSEESFLRVHLPSGRVVTLHDPGKLRREVRLSDLADPAADRPSTDPAVPPTLREVMAFQLARESRRTGGRPASFGLETAGPADAAPTSTLPDRTRVDLWLPYRPVPPARPLHPGEVRFATTPQDVLPAAYDLQTAGPGGRLLVRLPGSLREVVVRADEAAGGLKVVSVRVATADRAADAAMTFLARGDLYSAAGMAGWAEATVSRFRVGPPADWFTAVVAGYLLLRAGRLDPAADWVQRLPRGWPGVTDGMVIRAWQLIGAREGGTEAKVRELLFRAAHGPLPVFTEGLNRLRDGLLLLGESARDLVRDLSQHAGQVLPDSPFCASLSDLPEADAPRTLFSVGYAAG